MEEPAAATCASCPGEESPVTGEETAAFLSLLPGWEIVGQDGVRQLERTFAFRDFAGAMAFANRVAAEAEKEGHHPSLLAEWGRVTVGWWTHKTGGLHRNDFVMAAKTDACAEVSS